MSNTKKFVFAGAAALAMLTAGAAFAAGAADAGPRQMRPVCEFNTDTVEANVKTIFADIGAALNLNAKQKKAFDAYVKVRADFAAEGAEWHNKAYDKFSDAKTRQDAMKIRSEHRADRAAQFKKLTDVRGAFVATLTPEQVEKFDAMEPGYGMRRGHRGHMMGMGRGGHCGMGMGMGMGPHHGMRGGYYGWHHYRMSAPTQAKNSNTADL